MVDDTEHVRTARVKQSTKWAAKVINIWKNM